MNIQTVVSALFKTHSRSAVGYVSRKHVIKATMRHRANARHSEVLVSVGVPSYRERAFIRQAVKAGERFPIRKVQLRQWPRGCK